MRRAAAVTLIATGAVMAATLSATNEPRPSKPPTPERVVWAINHQRSERGLSRLGVSASLARAARRWSTVLSRRGVLSHATNLLGSWRWIGETLYRGPGSPTRPWLLSPPHRAIILAPQPRLIGVARTGTTWVARFGRAR